MLKFLGGATFIQGDTSIPESRVVTEFVKLSDEFDTKQQ
jgi:hypothetical protein